MCLLGNVFIPGIYVQVYLRMTAASFGILPFLFGVQVRWRVPSQQHWWYFYFRIDFVLSFQPWGLRVFFCFRFGVERIVDFVRARSLGFFSSIHVDWSPEFISPFLVSCVVQFICLQGY